MCFFSPVPSSIKQDNTLLPLCPAALALDNHGNGHLLSTHYMLGPELPLSQSYRVGSVITLTDEKTDTQNSS